ncbi:MAG: hypothetical protein Fur0019_14680 [Tibeticola sp.]
MNTWVHPSTPAPAAGSASREAARGLAAFLLAAIVSAVFVVADQIIANWADGHLLVAWAGLWALGFVALVLLGGTVRRFAGRLIEALDAWAAERAQRRADARLWAIACTDPRVMADLQAAFARAEDERADADAAPTARLAAARAPQPAAVPFPYY